MHLRALTLLTGATLSIASPGPNHNAPSPPHLPSWTLLNHTASTARFRGLSPVSELVAWVSGTNGTVLKTEDGGSTFLSVGPSTADTKDETPVSWLEFRDIQAFSATHAVILSIGPGSDSRVYFTVDGGKNWVRSFTNREAGAFYDCFAFDGHGGKGIHGLAMSDPVDGKFRLIETFDSGATWKIVDYAQEKRRMPPAKEGEAGFAASGTCIATDARGRWYMATGGAGPDGRIFRSEDDGRDWAVSANSTIPGSASGGVFSVQFLDEHRGIAVGGDFENPTGSKDNAAFSTDGGKTWQPSTKFPAGYRSGSAWVVSGPKESCSGGGDEKKLRDMALAVGPTGSDFTLDAGRTWQKFDDGSFDSVACVPAKGKAKGKGKGRVCWASGQGGRVGKLLL
ncbi:oxidoreductase [Xylariaceae sp. FL0594]|nr:oxidoreductase [Xylariaceae sp. FL0594]